MTTPFVPYLPIKLPKPKRPVSEATRARMREGHRRHRERMAEADGRAPEEVRHRPPKPIPPPDDPYLDWYALMLDETRRGAALPLESLREAELTEYLQAPSTASYWRRRWWPKGSAARVSVLRRRREA